MMCPKSENLSKYRIIKNLSVISFSFVLMFTAYDGLSMLQSTINDRDGTGTTSLAILYVGFSLSAFLLPKFVIKKLGCKLSLVLSMSTFLPYLAANYYPTCFLLWPTAFILGIGSSIIWGAQCTYFNISIAKYCSSNNKNEHALKSSVNVSENKLKELGNNHINTYEKNNEINFPSSNEISMTVKTSDNVCPNYSENGLKKCCDYSITSAKSEISNLCATSQMYCGKCTFCSNHFMDVPNSLNALNYVNQCDDKNNDNDVTVPRSEVQQNNPLPKKFVKDQTHALQIKRRYFNFRMPVWNTQKRQENFNSIRKVSKLEFMTAWFFGCHGLAYHSAQVWSNLISYFIFQSNNALDAAYNITCACGADFCNADSNCSSDVVRDVVIDVRYILTGSSVVIGLISIFILILFLDPLYTEEKSCASSFDLILATLKQCGKREQQLLIPLSSYVGMLQGFYTADFTKAYVSCAWGTSNIGLVTVYYGLASILTATLAGRLIKYVGRIPVLMTGGLLNITVNVFMLMWHPDSSETYMFILAAALWGVAFGVFWAQIPAFYGVIFKEDEEAAFATFYMWSSLGWTLALFYSDSLCTSIKVYILLTVSSVGLVGYLATELMHHRKQLRLN